MTWTLHFGTVILLLACGAGAYDKVYRRTILNRTSPHGVISNTTAQSSQQFVANGDGDHLASSTGDGSTRTSHLTGRHDNTQGDQRFNSTRGGTGPIRNVIQGRKRTRPETSTSLSGTHQENQPGKLNPSTRTLPASLGSLNVLASFAGKNRVLVISAPRRDDRYYRMMMTLLRRDAHCEMAERHMQQIVVFHQRGATGGRVRRVNSRGQVLEQPLDPALVPRLMNFLKLEEGKFGMVLLKKNLRVEERYSYPVRMEAVYEKIDQTHMRKLEKSRQRGFVQRCRAAGVEGQLIESEVLVARGSNTRENGTLQRLPTRKVMERPAQVPKQTAEAATATTTSATAQGNATTITKPTTTTTKMTTTAKPTTIAKPTTTTTKRTTTAKPTTIAKPTTTTTAKPTPQTKPPPTDESPYGIDQLSTKPTSHPITESHDLTGSIGGLKNQYEHQTDPKHKQANGTSATQLTHENEGDLASDRTHKIGVKKSNVTSHDAEREEETDKAIERNTAAKKRTKAAKDGDGNVRRRKPGKKGGQVLVARGSNTRENGTQRLPTRKVMERPAQVPKQTTEAVTATTTSTTAQGNATTITKPTTTTTKMTTTAKPTTIAKPSTTTTAKPTPRTKPTTTTTTKPTPRRKPTTTTTTKPTPRTKPTTTTTKPTPQTKPTTTTTKPTPRTKPTTTTTTKPTPPTKPTTTTTKPTPPTKPTTTTTKPTPRTKPTKTTTKPTPPTKPTTTTKPTPRTKPTTTTTKVRTTLARKITATTISSTTTAETSRRNLGPPPTDESPYVLPIDHDRHIDQLSTKPTSHPITESHDLTSSIGGLKNQYEHQTDPKHKQANGTSATQLTHENEGDLASDRTHKIGAKKSNVTSHDAEREEETDKAIERNPPAKKRTKAAKDGDGNVRRRKPGKKGAMLQEKYGGAKVAVRQPNAMRPLALFFNTFDRRRRLLVITAPSVDNRMFTQQRDEYLEQVCEMAVRKISVIVIFGTWNNGTMKIDHFQLEQDHPLKGVPNEVLTKQPLINALRKELGMTFNDYYMVLTDFDMKVKQEYEVPIAMKAVFDYIDTFPSRIEEMEQQKKQGLTCKREDNSRSLENFLSRFRWRRRLFVMSAPAEDEWAYQQQLHALTSQACNLGLRHMSILKLVGKNMADMGGVLELYPINGSATVEREDLSASLVKDIRNYYQIGPEYFSMLLVGKDGNVKSWYPSPLWSMSVIYDLVDSMQLRRQEMAIQQSLGMRCSEDEDGHHSYHDSDQDGYQRRGYGY